jgi:hypothetical protein
MMISSQELKAGIEREKRSQEHRKRFLKGDELALKEFVQNDPFALDTDWVKTVISNAMLTGDDELLKRLFVPGRGKRAGKGRVAMMVENLIILDACNRLMDAEGWKVTATKNKDTVFDVLYDRQVFTFGVVQEFEPKTLRERYYQALKQEPDVMLETTPLGRIVKIGPVKVEINGKAFIGITEKHFPENGGEMIIKFRGVFNIPTGQDQKDQLPAVFQNIPSK